MKQLDKEGKKVELMVCAECGKKRGLSGVEKTASGKGDTAADLKVKTADQSKKRTCSSCGMSFTEFKRRGKLGCTNCYSSFDEELQHLIRRLHGSVHHTGKGPNQGRKVAQEVLRVQRLRAELDAAIKEEDYERAAGLRDRLKQLKQTGDETRT